MAYDLYALHAIAMAIGDVLVMGSTCLWKIESTFRTNDSGLND